jgi:hypothetical protein
MTRSRFIKFLSKTWSSSRGVEKEVFKELSQSWKRVSVFRLLDSYQVGEIWTIQGLATYVS